MKHLFIYGLTCSWKAKFVHETSTVLLFILMCTSMYVYLNIYFCGKLFFHKESFKDCSEYLSTKQEKWDISIQKLVLPSKHNESIYLNVKCIHPSCVENLQYFCQENYIPKTKEHIRDSNYWRKIGKTSLWRKE